MRVSVFSRLLVAVALCSREPAIALQVSRDSAVRADASLATSSLSGQVVTMIDGRPSPVRRARVTLSAEDQPAPLTTDSSTDGRYRFDNVPAGTYRVASEKDGFVLLDHPEGGAAPRPPPIVLEAGQSRSLDVIMHRGAAVEGRLLTDSGDPAANIVVSAIRFGYGPTGPRAVPVRQARTDDLGRFRVHTLPPGEYYVDAAPDPLQALQQISAPGERPPGIARTYYPGTPRLNDAHTITLSLGQQVSGCEFAMTNVPLAVVKGSVSVASGQRPSTFSVRLQGVGAAPGQVRGLLVPQTNTFQFPSVPPGDYWLMAAALAGSGADPEFAVERITVAGVDLPELQIVTAKGAVLNGRVSVEDDVPVPSSLELIAHETEFELPLPQPSQPMPAVPVRVAADGTFALASLFGLRVFRLGRLPKGWALKEIWLDDAAITDAPADFRATTAPRALRVIVTPLTASVAGTVEDAQARRAPGRVVVFSQDERQWNALSRYTKTVEVGTDGQYVVDGLLPGKYFIVAVSYLPDTAWNDPAMLRRLRPMAQVMSLDARGAMTAVLKLRLPQ